MKITKQHLKRIIKETVEEAVNEMYKTRPGHVEAKYALVKNGYDINQSLSSPKNDAAITDALELGSAMRDDFNYDDINNVINNWDWITI